MTSLVKRWQKRFPPGVEQQCNSGKMAEFTESQVFFIFFPKLEVSSNFPLPGGGRRAGSQSLGFKSEEEDAKAGQDHTLMWQGLV